MAEIKNGGPARTWATMAHLAALAGVTGVPFANVLGPLCVFLLKRRSFPIVEKECKKSLNFQISITLYCLLSLFLLHFYIGFFLIIALIIFDIVYVVKASLKVSSGSSFKYPITIRFLT